MLERERARSRGHEEQLPDASRRRPERQPEKDRLKTLYRTLVRQLHPDGNRNQGWRERELWHEVQAAYQARDLDRLEDAAGRVEMGLNGASAALSVRTRLRLTSDLLRELAGLKNRQLVRDGILPGNFRPAQTTWRPWKPGIAGSWNCSKPPRARNSCDGVQSSMT